MSFFTKLLHFLKNIHPIRNFAKPISRNSRNQSTAIASNFASVPISYEALKAELLETPQVQVSEYHEVTPSYIQQESLEAFDTFATETNETQEQTREMEMNSDDVITAPAIVIRKLSVRPEESMVLSRDVEEPLAPDTVISEIVDLSQYQTGPESAGEMPEESPEAPETTEEEAESDLILVESVISTVSVTPVEKVKKTRSTKKATSKTTVHAPAVKARISKKPSKTIVKAKTQVKKSIKSVKSKKPVSKRKAPTPKEAMGFGF